MIPSTLRRLMFPVSSLSVWTGSLAITLNLGLLVGPLPGLAADPFRTNNPRAIGDMTEAAFVALFEQGNYDEAKRYLEEAVVVESNEPLAHAMRASLAYTEDDWQNLKIYADKTLKSAEKIQGQDPVRGNMYLAVGHFLAGTYIYKTEGPLGALPKLQQVFFFLDAAAHDEANDPELNLLKGYLDLILAVNLPFASPDQAIARLEEHAAPAYLVDRGIAVAYRDLNQLDQALTFAEQALEATPDNPEVYYLAGQILRKKGRATNNVTFFEQADEYFEQALAKSEQLPQSILQTIKREHRKTQEKIAELGGQDSSQTDIPANDSTTESNGLEALENPAELNVPPTDSSDRPITETEQPEGLPPAN